MLSAYGLDRDWIASNDWLIHFGLDWIGDDEFAILREMLPSGRTFNCALVEFDSHVVRTDEVGVETMRIAVMNTANAGFAATDCTFTTDGSLTGGTFVLYVSDDNDIGLLAGHPGWVERYAKRVRELPHADSQQQFEEGWNWIDHETGDWYRHLQPVMA